MLVTGKSILSKKLIEGGTAAQLKSAGYHLRIQSIIPNNQDRKDSSVPEPVSAYKLGPSEIAVIISKEKFTIPRGAGITALVTLASSKTKQGLLALDHGIVDPTFEGPIGTSVINFSSTDVVLRENDEFFRVLFLDHGTTELGSDYPDVKYTHETYIEDQQNKLLKDFSRTFLNTSEVMNEVSDKIITEQWPQLEGILVRKIAWTVLKRYWWIAFITLLLVPHLLPFILGIISPFFPEGFLAKLTAIGEFIKEISITDNTN